MKDVNVDNILLALHDEIGEGEVLVHPTFADLPSLQKADLLQDWIEKLEDMYESVTTGDFLTDLGSTGINEPPASETLQ